MRGSTIIGNALRNIDTVPFVKASITPLFSKYLRNSSFLESGVCGIKLETTAPRKKSAHSAVAVKFFAGPHLVRHSRFQKLKQGCCVDINNTVGVHRPTPTTARASVAMQLDESTLNSGSARGWIGKMRTWDTRVRTPD